jgi:Exportin 1-like protein
MRAMGDGRQWQPPTRPCCACSVCRALSEEERAHLRAKLLEVLAQEDSKIAVQLALVFAKVARQDYPAAWPSLFPDLLARLAAGDTLVVRRVYLVLHHVLKELSSKRLAVDQRNFGTVSAAPCAWVGVRTQAHGILQARVTEKAPRRQCRLSSHASF